MLESTHIVELASALDQQWCWSVWILAVDHRFFERKIANIFLPVSLNICFGCSKEPSHWDSSFEYPQYMFWLRNKKIIFLLRTDLTNAWLMLTNIQHLLTAFFHKVVHCRYLYLYVLSKWIRSARTVMFDWSTLELLTPLTGSKYFHATSEGSAQ